MIKGKFARLLNSKIKTNQDQYEDNKRVEILPQSRVDAFIASKKPTERYEALVNFWGGQDDSKYYRAIIDLVKHNEKAISRIEEQISQCNDEIIKLLIPNEKAIFIDDLTQKIKNKGLLSSDSEFFKKIEFQSDLNNLNIYINNKIAEFEVSKSTLSLNIDRASKLSILLKDFTNKNNEKESIIKKIKEKKELSNLSQERITLKEKESSIINKIKDLEIDQANLNFLKENKIIYNDFSEKIDLSNNSISLLTLDSHDLKNRLNGLEYDKTLSAQQIEVLLTNRAAAFNKREDLININNQYTIYKDKLEKYKKRLSLAKNIATIRENNIQSIKNKINNNNILLSFDIEAILNSSILENNNPTVEQLKVLQKNLNEIGITLKEQNEIYIKSQSLNSDLQKIISLGHEHITSTNSSTCPLCNLQHESYSILLDRINSQRSDTLGLEKIKLRIDELNLQYNKIKNDINKIIDEYKESILKINDSLNNSLSNLEHKLNRTSVYISYYSLEIQIIDDNIKQLQFRLLNYNIENFNSGSIVENLRIEISVLDSSIEITKNTLSTIVNSINEINQKITLNASNISELASEVYLFSNNNVFIMINDLLNKLNINPDNYNENGVTLQIDSLDKKTKELNEDLEAILKSVKTIDDLLLDKDISHIWQQLQDDEYTLSTLNSELSDFSIQYYKLFNNHDYNQETISNRLNQLNQNLIDIDENLLMLRQFKENTDFFLNDILIRSKKENLLALQDNLDKHNKIKVTINKIHSNLSSFLTSKINSIFNHDIINDIYQKIDPHPNFKKILLEPIFLDKPELLIKVYDQNNTNIIDPVLYLSSAQISILSLSIFLAKAIQNSSPLVNTIFMDDPIQYMDSINSLSFIDLIRSIISNDQINRQVVLSTHDENFFRLLKRKFDPRHYNSKFIEYQSYGILKENI